MCNHEHTKEVYIDTSVEVWQNGVGEWVEQEAGVLTCLSCGAIYNKEKSRWEL